MLTSRPNQTPYIKANVKEGLPDTANCKMWRITPKILPVLRKVYIYGWKISEAARSEHYTVRHIYKVMGQLRKRGILQDVVDGLSPFDQADTDKIFYEKLKVLIEDSTPQFMAPIQFYAKLTGKIKDVQAPGIQTNIQINAGSAKIAELRKKYAEDEEK